MRDCPARDLRNRYIPIEDSYEVCGVTEDEVFNMIKNKDIRYAEFKKPGCKKRSIHIDPVEVGKFLESQID